MRNENNFIYSYNFNYILINNPWICKIRKSNGFFFFGEVKGRKTKLNVEA